MKDEMGDDGICSHHGVDVGSAYRVDLEKSKTKLFFFALIAARLDDANVYEVEQTRSRHYCDIGRAQVKGTGQE